MAFNFIDYFLEYTKEAESPEIFFKWTALATLAAVARDNFYYSTKLLTIYPNIYVLLFAESGKLRKGLPCQQALKLIKEIKNTHVISGRTSIQAVINELGMSYTTEDKGTMVKGASGIVYNEELAAAIVEDRAVISILTNLWDFQEDWDSGLVSRDKVSLKNVCLTFLSGTNEQLFHTVYDENAKKGGLLGRTFVVTGKKPRARNSLMPKFDVEGNIIDENDNFPKKPLLDHLQKIAKLRGNAKNPIKMQPDREAAAWFDTWYKETDFYKNESHTGFEPRMHTHAIKIATLLALAEEPISPIIRLRHFQQAVDLIVELLPIYRRLGIQSAKTPDGDAGKAIMLEILKAAPDAISQPEIMRRHWGIVDVQTLGKITEKFELAKLIRVIPQGKDIGYVATDHAINMYMEQTKAKKVTVN